MSYSAEAELAMILPLPVPPLESDEDAVRFIDLSGYVDFFSDMANGFPMMMCRSRARAVAASAPLLRVHSVGSFDASFVPTLADFDRLDRRFKLPTEVWTQLPAYSDYGFAVFKLKPGAKQAHPMAFEFPTRNTDRLFFPTVHIHEGKVDSEAEFDHSLYCQIENGSLAWRISTSDEECRHPISASEFMDVPRTRGVVNPELPIYRYRILDMQKNEDILVGAK